MINEVELICEACGCLFLRSRAEYNRQQKIGRSIFCSLKCSATKNAQNFPKKDPPQIVTLNCSECGCNFERLKKIYTSKIKSGQTLMFCSNNCSNENHKKYIPQKICKQCQLEYFAKRNGKFCSSECRKLSIKPIRHKMDEFSPFRGYLRKIFNHSKNKNCSLTLQDLKNQWEKQNGICPYSGIKLILPKCTGLKSSISPYQPSIDRIDSNIGYELNNIEFISLMAQYGKNIFSKEEFIKFCNLVTENVASAMIKPF